MKTFTVDLLSIQCASEETKECPIRLEDNLFVSHKEIPYCLIGEAVVSFPQFYAADCPQLEVSDYVLSKEYQNIIKRFPDTNTSMIELGKDAVYRMKKVPVYITIQDYLSVLLFPETYQTAHQEVTAIKQWSAVTQEELEEVYSYKRKRLQLDGSYGRREFLAPNHKKHAKQIQHKLNYFNEMYSFMHYSYAAMIEFSPEYGIETYQQFHEAYGKDVYSFTVTKNNQTIPMLWPDYLYHQPENHLEFGVLANTQQARYQPFDSWEEGEAITIEILANGFEDVVIETKLKKRMSKIPSFSKKQYQKNETIYFTADEEILKEISQNKADIELVTPQKVHQTKERISFEIQNGQLTMDAALLQETGMYQFHVQSPVYGKILCFFSINEKE